MQKDGQKKILANNPLLGVCVIILITFILYIPAMQGGFVWDDDSFLTNNPLIKADDGLYRFWFTTEAPDYFPLTSSTLWLEWRVWGMNAFGYHLVNILLHIVSSLLIWLILKRLKIPGAWLAALIFAIHPVNVESVAWITQRKSTLPMAFYLLSIFLYLKFEETGLRRTYGLSLGSFLMALLSKTSVVMGPFVLLGCAWWQRGKITIKDLLRSIPFFALSGFLSLVTIWFQYNRSIGDDIVRTDGFLSRLAGAGWAVWFYLYKAIAPLKLSFVYPRWNIDASSFVSFIPGLFLAVLLVLFWWYRKSWGRPFLFGLGYFVVALFPVLGFFNIYFMRYSLVADHWQYQSIIGVIALLVGLGYYLCAGRQKKTRQAVTIALVIIIGLFSLQTWRQGHIYKDQETLFLDTIAKDPGCWMAHYNLGHTAQDQGRLSEALNYYDQAQRIQPDNPDPFNNMGNVLLKQGKVDEAIASFSKALQIKPDFADAHYNLGIALERKGNPHQAIAHFYEALRIRPAFAEVHNNLGNILAIHGRPHQAVVHFYQALRIKPAFADAHYNLGLVLKRLGKLEEAADHFREVLRIRPDYPKARQHLENILQVMNSHPQKP